MVQVLTGETVWYTNTAQRSMGPLVVERLSTGQLAVAFGGSTASGQGIVYTSLLNPSTGQLSAFSENILPGSSSGGLPVTTVRDLEMDATRDGKMVLTIHMANSEVGNDGNFALLTQVYNGRTPQGDPEAVNPSTAADNTYDVFATVTRANGSYVTFFSDIGGGTNLSNGIRMASFRADGSMIGQPKTVIADRDVFVFGSLRVEANPEQLSATLMSNGNIGLVFKESTSNGQPRVVFQQVAPDGSLVGAAVELQGQAAILPQIVTLKDGKVLAVWHSTDQFAVNTLKAQLLSAAGDKLGAVFDIASSATGTQNLTDVVALSNGGFAVSWANGFNHAVARIFDANGVARGHDFALTDTSAAFDVLGASGLVANGTQLIGYVQGQETGSPQEILSQTFGLGATVGKKIVGGNAGQTHSGTARDDNISGLGGSDIINGTSGNDILSGGSGNDTITGGAGRDVIRGGAGRDVLSGNGGSDVFIFDALTDARDTIRDFKLSDGDKIGIDNIGFGREPVPGFFLPLIAVTLATGAVTDANASGFFFNTATKVLSYDADGAGALARVELAVLTGVSNLSSSDFLVV